MEINSGGDKIFSLLLAAGLFAPLALMWAFAVAVWATFDPPSSYLTMWMTIPIALWWSRINWKLSLALSSRLAPQIRSFLARKI